MRDFPVHTIDRMESVETKVSYYTDLLERALGELDRMTNPVMVCGPLFCNDRFEESCQIMRSYQEQLREDGLEVFDQIPYLDKYQDNAPNDPKIKFEVFYKGIITSGKIKRCYFIPGWDASRGATTERNFCIDGGIGYEDLGGVGK